MRLNHIDLQVPDVQQAAAFFVRWFGFALESNPHSPAMAILRGEGNFSLVLQRRAEGERYPATFHVGFLLDTPDEVQAFHARAREAGLAIGELERNGRGTLSYLRGPGDILIEVSCRRRPGG